MTITDSSTEGPNQAARRIEELQALLAAKQAELERERSERERLHSLLIEDDKSRAQQVERALRESEERFRLLTRHIGDAVFIRFGAELPNARSHLAGSEYAQERWTGSALRIKADPRLRHIPVVVLTTSKAEEDTVRTYELGANSFISKPVTFEGLLHVVSMIGEYWFELVALPSGASR